MGQRAVIYIEGAAAAVYVHWVGDKALGFLGAALPRMRPGDPEYATARLIGHLHEHLSGGLGLGVLPPPTAKDKAGRYAEYSRGNSGVIVVDGKLTEARCYAGEEAARFSDAIDLKPYKAGSAVSA